VIMLRVQRERMSGVFRPSTREYSRTCGLNAARLALAKPDAIVMHPGPMNRGVEIDPAIADGPRSVILDQVEAGVAVRMAVLWLLAAEANEPKPTQPSRDRGQREARTSARSSPRSPGKP